MKYVIEDYIPIPPAKRGGQRKGEAFSALEALKPGQSVWLDVRPDTVGGRTKRLVAEGRRFTTRKEARDGIDGVRIWRVE